MPTPDKTSREGAQKRDRRREGIGNGGHCAIRKPFQEVLVKYCQGSDIDSRIGTATCEGGQRNLL